MPRSNAQMVSSHRARSVIVAKADPRISPVALLPGKIRAVQYPPKTSAHLKAEKRNKATHTEFEVAEEQSSAAYKALKVWENTPGADPAECVHLKKMISERTNRLAAAKRDRQEACAALAEPRERYRHTLQIHANDQLAQAMPVISDGLDFVMETVYRLVPLHTLYESHAASINRVRVYPPCDHRVSHAAYMLKPLQGLYHLLEINRPDIQPGVDMPGFVLPDMSPELAALKADMHGLYAEFASARETATRLIHERAASPNPDRLNRGVVAADNHANDLENAWLRARELFAVKSEPYRAEVGAALTAAVARMNGDIQAARAVLACLDDAIYALQAVAKTAGGTTRPIFSHHKCHEPHILIERLRSWLAPHGGQNA